MHIRDHTPASEDVNLLFSRRRIARGVSFFVLFSFLGLGGLVVFTGGTDLSPLVGKIRPAFLGLAFLALVGDLVSGSYRYHILIRQIVPDAPFHLALRAQLANRFLAAITPSQTGGGPALLYVYHRGGVPLPQGLSVLTLNFLVTLIFFFTASILSILCLKDLYLSGTAVSFLQYSYTAFLALTIPIIIALFKPAWLNRWLNQFTSSQNPEGSPGSLVRWLRQLFSGVEQFHTTCYYFLRQKPWLLAESLLFTFVLYGMKFMMAYFVIRGIGVDVSFQAAIAIQALLHFFLYLAPSPGASGIAEVSTGALMSVLLPTYFLGIFTVIYRFFLTYLPATVGGFVLFHALRHPISSQAHPVPGCLETKVLESSDEHQTPPADMPFRSSTPASVIDLSA